MHRLNEPTVDEMREANRYRKIIRLGRLALFNRLTRTVVSGNDLTLTVLKQYCQKEFDDLTRETL